MLKELFSIAQSYELTGNTDPFLIDQIPVRVYPPNNMKVVKIQVQAQAVRAGADGGIILNFTPPQNIRDGVQLYPLVGYDGGGAVYQNSLFWEITALPDMCIKNAIYIAANESRRAYVSVIFTGYYG